MAITRRLSAVLAATLLFACGSNDDGQAQTEPGRVCATDDDCGVSEVCAVGRVRELELEAGDDARCLARDQAIGSAPASYRFVGGGRPLAERLCVAGGLNRGAGAAADAVRKRQLELLVSAGVRVIRLDFPWAEIEKQKGSFDFSALDPAVDAARASGLEVLGIIAYGTPWASSLTTADTRYPPDDPNDYATYARALASHFAGRVRRWELWNEPNAGWRFFRPKLNGDAAKYAVMMASAAAALHAECADCQVVSAGLFFHSQVLNGALEFTSDMLSATPSAFSGVDAFGIHPYPRYPPVAAPEVDTPPERGFGGMFADLDAVLDGYAVNPLPYAVTELGWPSFGAVDEGVQAAFLARSVLLGAAVGADPLCWFNLADGPNHGTFPPEDDFGLYRFGSDDPNGVIANKPARDALARLATLGADVLPLGASQVGAFHDPSAGQFALDFEGPSGRVTALWQLANEPTSLQLSAETRHAEDLFGATVAVPAGGALSVSVGSSPLYLVP